MKVCNICNINKPDKEFFNRGGRRKDSQAACSPCQNRLAREYRQATRDKVGAYKINKGCEVCGFQAQHPCQLDLDHTDPSTKTYKGSHKSYDAGWSWKRVEAEIAKCVVTCKNCHSLRTYKEGHWKNVHTDISMRQSSAQLEDH